MDTIVSYRNRKIDLEPYFNGFPYAGFKLMDDVNELYYFHRGDRLTLRKVPLTEDVNLEQGEKISDLDFSKFSCGRFKMHPSKNAVLFTGDECNDERFNIYELDLGTGNKRKITDEEYIYGWSYVQDKKAIALLGRKKTSERMETTLKIMDVKSEQVRDLVTDDEVWTFTWSSILHDPKTGCFIMAGNKHYDRNQSNILLYNPETGERRVLLEDGVKRAMFSIDNEFLDDHSFLYMSDESGFLNMFSFDLSTGTSRQITHWTEYPLGGYEVFKVDGKALIFATQGNPVQDTLFVIDPENGHILYQKKMDGKFNAFSANRKRLFASQVSHTKPLVISELLPEMKAGKISISSRIILQYPQNLLKKILHGTAEAIKYPTFDIDADTGKTRMIHGFLLVPNNLPEKVEDRRAIIEAFYGGENFYNRNYQVLLEAGIIVFSPAVRGSWGFGADYYSLNDKDLGGNEIIDLIFAGRYLCEKFGLSEQQVGLTGGSHGGYCSTRALTFPEEVNGRREFFNWGFAISEFGISNIIDYYETCNIPDWVLQKAGDPKTEKEKLMDRSPLMHAHRATGPLFLIHGENDNRVPVDQSRQMAEAMKKAGKTYTYVELPGQGHGWSGLGENLKYFQALFTFLNTV